jgi:hypothetical protein
VVQRWLPRAGGLEQTGFGAATTGEAGQHTATGFVPFGELRRRTRKVAVVQFLDQSRGAHHTTLQRTRTRTHKQSSLATQRNAAQRSATPRDEREG